MKLNPFNKKVGLALGGGAAKGVAHLGVLRALKEKNVEIDFISGTSAGAIVASYFAFKKDLSELDGIPQLLRAKSVMNFSLNKMGLMSTELLEKALKKDFGDAKIEDATIPLSICATNIITGESTYFRSGPLVAALCASAALPGIVQPVEISGQIMVDGGISNNVPVDILNTMGAGIIIGVDLNGFTKYPEVNSVIDVVTNSIDIAIDLKTKQQLNLADIVVSLDLSKYSRIDNLDEYKNILSEAHQETLKKINRIQWFKILSWLYFFKKFIKEFSPIKLPSFFKNRDTL